MGNPLYSLIALLLALTYPTGFEPLWILENGRSPWLPALTCLAATGLYALACLLLFSSVRDAGRRDRIRFGMRLVALVVYGAEIYLAHLPRFVWSTLGLEWNFLLGGLVLLLPYLLLFAIQAGITSWREKSTEGLAFALRAWTAFSFLPILFLLSIYLVLQQSVELQRFAYVVPFAATFGLMGALTLFLFAMPAVLQVIFAARPLPPGPLRDRLDRLCRIAKTPCPRGKRDEAAPVTSSRYTAFAAARR